MLGFIKLKTASYVHLWNFGTTGIIEEGTTREIKFLVGK